MECREFRNLLLLLREDLEEKDIPHRTKLREAIITAWQSWFTGLKRELAVSIATDFRIEISLILYSGSSWTD